MGVYANKLHCAVLVTVIADDCLQNNAVSRAVVGGTSRCVDVVISTKSCRSDFALKVGIPCLSWFLSSFSWRKVSAGTAVGAFLRERCLAPVLIGNA